MSCDLHITRHAERDIQAAADYIEFDLYDPEAADDMLDEATEKIEDLVNFPMKYPLADDPILKSWGIRYFAVKKYIVFYVIAGQTIYVVRFLNQRRDWISILHTEGINTDKNR